MRYFRGNTDGTDDESEYTESDVEDISSKLHRTQSELRSAMPGRKRIGWFMIAVGCVVVVVAFVGRVFASKEVESPMNLEFQRYAIGNASFEFSNYEEAMKDVAKDHGYRDRGFSWNNAQTQPQEWMSETFPREKIAENMDYVGCHGNSRKGSGIPEDFSGLWWMDGNPAPEDVSSFGQGVWTPGLHGCRTSKVYHYTDEEKKKGIIKDLFNNEAPCKGRLTMDYYDERTWAWPQIPGIRELVRAVKLGTFMVEFVCGGHHDMLTICKVAVPSAGAKYMAKVFPTDYYMVRVSKSQWIRYTPTHFGIHQYYLKQITDCSGQPVEPFWKEFNSGGWSKPEFQKDVYGHGGDTRWWVKSVPKTLYVRVNLADPRCPKKTGSCHMLSCHKSEAAICQEGECFCGQKGECARNGRCVL